MISRYHSSPYHLVPEGRHHRVAHEYSAGSSTCRQIGNAYGENYSTALNVPINFIIQKSKHRMGRRGPWPPKNLDVYNNFTL